MILNLSADQLRVQYMRMTRLGCLNHLRHELEKEPCNEEKIKILREVIDEKTEALNTLNNVKRIEET